MLDQEQTHRQNAVPKVSVNRLADYMAASEQVKRSMLTSFKYPAIARVVQHNDARSIIANHLCSPNRTEADLRADLDDLEGRLCDSQFESDTLDHNCDYLRRFLATMGRMGLPAADYAPTDRLPADELNGTKVTFWPQAVVSRVTRRNTRRVGTLMLRYAKNRSLSAEVGLWESAFMFGYLTSRPLDEVSRPDKALCLTVDCYEGVAHQAPGDAVYRYKEMHAACGGIAERWAAVKPPAGAVF